MPSKTILSYCTQTNLVNEQSTTKAQITKLVITTLRQYPRPNRKIYCGPKIPIWAKGRCESGQLSGRTLGSQSAGDPLFETGKGSLLSGHSLARCLSRMPLQFEIILLWQRWLSWKLAELLIGFSKNEKNSNVKINIKCVNPQFSIYHATF